MVDERKRPYYEKPIKASASNPMSNPMSKRTPANVVPVEQWTIAQVLFWKIDGKKK